MKDIFLKLMSSIFKNYMNFIMIYRFYLKEWKLKKVVANLHDKTEYVIHIRNFNHALNHGLVFKKVHRVIKFNQAETMYWHERRPKKKSKKWFRIMQFLEKLCKIWEKYRDIKLVTTERGRSYLASEPNYHNTKFFTEHLLAIEMKKIQIFLNEPVYLGLSTLELS